MTITFVGTGSGKTSLKRFHSSILISDNIYNFLIDCGDGISRALLNKDINYNLIDCILITHFHPDHYSGLPTLLINMKLSERQKPLTIYVHKKMVGFTESLLLHSYLSGLSKQFDLEILPYQFDRDTHISNNIKFYAAQNSHIINKHDIPASDIFYSSSILFELNNKNIFYTSDIGKPEDLFLYNNKVIDILISETTHVPLKTILEAADLQKIKKVFLTHISDEDEPSLLSELNSINFSGEVKITSDGLKIFL